MGIAGSVHAEVKQLSQNLAGSLVGRGDCSRRSMFLDRAPERLQRPRIAFRLCAADAPAAAEISMLFVTGHACAARFGGAEFCGK